MSKSIILLDLNKPHNFYFFSIISGLLVYFLLPPFNFFLLEFFIFIPLMYIYHPINKNMSYKKIILYLFLFGLTIMLVNANWITYTIENFGNLSFILSYFIFFIYSCYLALKFVCIFFFPIFLKRRYNYPVLPALLVFCFFSEAFFPEIFAFYIANPQIYHTFFIQIADIIGVQGISLLVILVNYVIYGFISTHQKKYILFLSIIFFMTYSYSFLRFIEIESYNTKQKQYTKEIAVGSIQPNILFAQTSTEDQLNNTEKLIHQTDELLKLNPNLDLIVWPESSLPSYLQNGPFGEKIQNYIHTLDVPIIYNALKTNGNEYFSVAVIKYPHSDKTDFYAKTMLMPFGEYLPTDKFFPSLHKYFPAISSFTPGKTQNNFILDDQVILAPQICYEITAPYFTRKFTSQGANLIINITNDSWFGNTKASLLHLWSASFRAVENRTPIVRSTNTGISTIIGIKGYPIIKETQLFEDTIFVSNIKIYLRMKTIYSYFGDFPLGIFLLYLFIRLFFIPQVSKRPWFLQF